MNNTKRIRPTMSPCTKKCRVVDGTCLGCFRTFKEISDWKFTADEDKIKIVEQCQKRKDISEMT